MILAEREKGVDLLSISQQWDAKQQFRWSQVWEMIQEMDGDPVDRKAQGQSSADFSVIGAENFGGKSSAEDPRLLGRVV